MRMEYVAFGLVAGFAAIGHAQAATSAKLLEGFTVDNISAVLRDVDATEVTNVPIEGDPRLSFKLNDRIYLVDFYECGDKAKGCKVLQFVTAFELDPKDTVEAVNAFNKKYLYGKAVLDKEDGLMSMRMVNGREGSSDRQVAAEIGVLAGVTDVLLAHMKESAIAAYAPAPTTAQLALSPQYLISRSHVVKNKR